MTADPTPTPEQPHYVGDDCTEEDVGHLDALYPVPTPTPEQPRHDPTDHDCRGGVRGDRYPLSQARPEQDEAVRCYCGREIIFDGSPDVRRWVHYVEPTPNNHAATPKLHAKEVRCPKCSHTFVSMNECATPPPATPAALTHGRHCPCSACAREDWTNPNLAPCGMHGADCPPVYAPATPAALVPPTGAAMTLHAHLKHSPEVRSIADRWRAGEVTFGKMIEVIALAATPPPATPAALDDGRLSRSGWHYPRCWQSWASAWRPEEWECICARLTTPEASDD